MSDQIEAISESRERASLGYTRDNFRDAALALMPPGWAWSRDPESVQYKLWTGLVGPHWTAYRRALDMLEEADPRTAYETLAMWETDCGLPDPCLENPPSTIEGRRAAVVARRQEGSTTTPAAFIALADRLGYTVDIIEHRPFRTWSGCDSFLNTEAVGWSHTWTVVVRNSDRAFRVMRANSPCNSYLREFPVRGELECIFERIKPAHTLVLFEYPFAP